MPRQSVPIIILFAVVAAAVTWILTPEPYESVMTNEPDAAAGLTPDSNLAPCTKVTDSYLDVTLFGSLQTAIKLHGEDLLCTGKLDVTQGRGRLAFSTGEQDSGLNLVFVMGLDGVTEDPSQQEIATNFTVLDQSNGLFFGTQGNGRCWTDLDQASLSATDDRNTLRIEGELYCSGAIPQIQGPGSLTIERLRFAGVMVSVNAGSQAKDL